jgi:hypothetical protein
VISKNSLAIMRQRSLSVLISPLAGLEIAARDNAREYAAPQHGGGCATRVSRDATWRASVSDGHQGLRRAAKPSGSLRPASQRRAGARKILTQLKFIGK